MTWVARMAVSIAAAAAVTAALVGLATALGWLTLDGHADNGEIGAGILILAVGSLLTGALVQAIARKEAGPEVLAGPVIALLGLCLVASLFDGDRDLRKVIGGMLFVLVLQLKLGQVAARLAWVLRSRAVRGRDR